MSNFNKSGGYALAGWDVVLQLRRALKGERDALFSELDHLGVGFARSGPALYIGRLRPPGVAFMMMEDSYGFRHFRQWQVSVAQARDDRSPLAQAGCPRRVVLPYAGRRPRP